MGERIERTVDSVRRLLRRVLVLKYIVIGLMTILSGVLLHYNALPGSKWHDLAESIFYFGLVALILSIINDVVLRREQDELMRTDRAEFATLFAKDFFAIHAGAAVTDELLGQLMESPARREMVVRKLASLVTTEPSLRASVESSYLEPVHRPPRFKSCTAISRLDNYKAATGSYVWTCRQTMTTISTVQNYRLFVCSKSDIAAVVESSTRATDFVILLSSFSKNDVRRWLDEKFKFEVSRVDPKTGDLIMIDVERNDNLDELRAHPKCANIDEEDGVYCRLNWQDASPGVRIEMRFDCELSLKDDPFFAWTLQDYAFVELIEVDYSQIKPHCGRVSAVPYIRNSGCNIEHNREAGVLRVRVGGLAGPGEGAVVIFRQGSQSKWKS